MQYGYARVSSTDQNADRQLIALQEHAVERKNIFLDKKSGKDFERPQYQRLLKKLKEGDRLYVLSLDRLGRDYEEIQEQWQLLTKKKKVNICVIDMPLLDTKDRRELIETLIADVVLRVMSYEAHMERLRIRDRQETGIRAAKACGVEFGRPKKEMPENFSLLVEQWKEKRISTTEVIQLCGCSRATFFRRMKEGDEE